MCKYNLKYFVTDVTGNRFPVRPKHRFKYFKNMSLNNPSVLLIYFMKAPDIVRQDVTMVVCCIIEIQGLLSKM